MKSQHTKKVLIVGDSFAADWRVKYPDQLGWPNLLAQEYSVTNLAQAGCSEYRIYQQLKTTNIDHFDLILVSHTSAYRIYTEYHPARRDTALHKNCDLLYSDIEDLSQTQEEYKSVSTYFQKFFSLEFAEFTHELIWEKIYQLTSRVIAIHCTHVTPQPGNCLDFSDIFKKNSGLINHYSEAGNKLVFQIINSNIKQILNV